jgi:UMF1 family MFS transporter
VVRSVLHHRQGGHMGYSLTRGDFSFVYQSSSFVGPLAVGLIADLTGNIRYGFFFVVFMIWLAVPILMSVDVERGRVDAESYSYRTNDS